MIEILISLFITLLIVGIVWYALSEVIKILPVAEPIKSIANVVLVAIMCLILIYSLMPLIPHGRLAIR